MIVTLDQISVFGLVVARVLGVIVLAPFFSNRQLISSGKMALVFWFSILIIFVIPLPGDAPNDSLSFILAIVAEVLIGALIGFTSDLLVTGIEFAGSLMDTQAGLSVASILDPSTGKNAALLELLLRYSAIMIFLLIDGHHLVLSAIQQSFNLLPVGSAIDLTRGSRYVIELGKDIFTIAVHLSAPILLIVFLIDFSFGMLNRVSEQINIFQLGFQVKPSLSLLIFLAITPGLVQSILSILEDVLDRLTMLLGHLQG
ncbi:MAG: flagellar biosynthetic protein FliR [Candidatus Marinamargulisbacteria bacterium]|jgi:flagellar biosynthetic protein FliR